MKGKKDGGRSVELAETLPALKVGEFYRVLWRDNKKHVLAEILECRSAKPAIPKALRRSGRASVSSMDEASSCSGAVSDNGKGDVDEDDDNEDQEEGPQRRANELEYYVHYCDYDRRLDEWVTVDRVDLASGQQPAPVGGASGGHGHHGSTQSKKRRLDDGAGGGSAGGEGAGSREKDAAAAQADREHEEITKVKNIGWIQLGRHEMETWYYSPFPQEYCNVERLIVCEFCLKYMKKPKTFTNHLRECKLRHPPGDEVYRESNLSVFEVDGKANKIYCQNLCLLAKLFLDHKTLYYDVDPFLFYVLCESDDKGFHIVGYFSKEKNSTENFNLACILTFPPYQRSGYGKFLISLSYELTKLESKVGSPEKPLSDLGKLSYRSYWSYVILMVLKEQSDLSVKDLSQRTGMKVEDVVSTLQTLNMLKFWKGQHVIAVSQDVINVHLEGGKRMKLCNPACLTWEKPSARPKNG